MHPELKPYIHSLGVSVEYDHTIPEPARLFCLGDTPVILCRKGLSGPDLWVALGLELAYVALGFNCRRGINAEVAALEYDLAYEWAAQVMIPEVHKAMALRDGWTPRHLARLCYVTEEMAHHRIKGWMMPRRRPRPPAGRPGSF